MSKQQYYTDISQFTNNTKQPKRQKAFTAKSAIAIILCVVLAISGGGMVIFYNTIASVNYKAVDDNSANSNTLINPNGEINVDLQSGQLLNDPNILNILIFGEDSVKGDEAHGRSDTMLMLSIDNRHKKLKVTSFMRDMWVTIPGTDANGNPYGEDKINAAYTYGGPELSIKTVESNFGIDVDRYAVVDFKSFQAIIDALGGLDIELTDDEIGYINWQSYLNNQTEERNELQDTAGIVHLNGRQALWYARDRGFQEDEYPGIVFEGDDFTRTQRQRKMFSTLVAKFKKANLAQIVRIVGEVGPMVTTNLKQDEITTLVAHSLTYLSYQLEDYSVPQEGLWYYGTSIDGQQYLGLNDLNQSRTSLAKFIFQDTIE